MVNGVHRNTTGPGPAVPLRLHRVELAAGLEEGLVDTATAGCQRGTARRRQRGCETARGRAAACGSPADSPSSNDTDGATAVRRDDGLGAGGETDAGLAVVAVSDDGGVVARGTGEGSAVTGLLLDVADDGTLGALGDGEDVADVEGGLLAAVDERAGRDALGGDERLLAELVAVRVTEDDGGERGAATKVRTRLKGRARGRNGFGVSKPTPQPKLMPTSPTSTPAPTPSSLLISAYACRIHPLRSIHFSCPCPVPSRPAPSHATPSHPTHRPASWMMSLTTPLMYPFFSAKSSFLSLAGFLLWWVFEVKIPPDFL